MGMQSLLRLAYPPQCVSCGELVEDAFNLCGACWRETPFITGLVCDLCGVPLPGESDGSAVTCDDCMRIERPWLRGRSALVYRDNGRRLVLALKHGDRLDLVRPASRWLEAVAGPCLLPDAVIVPVPAHYTRLVKRRYNQAAMLAQAVASRTRHAYLPGLLRRVRGTRVQDGMSVEARFNNLSGAIQPAPTAEHRLAGRPILLIDDVLTSGATLSAATEASFAAGAQSVCVLALARVAKDA